MYFDPYFRQQAKSFVRLFHASPNTPAVDIYFGNQVVARSLRFTQFTQYLTVNPGSYNVRVFRSGETSNPIIDIDYTFRPNAIQTIAAADMLSSIKLIPFEEPKMPEVQGRSYIKFAHLSPNTGALDVALGNGDVLFRNISFGNASDYTALPQGTHIFNLRPTGTTNTVLHVPNIRVRPNRILTIYAIGLEDERPPLQVLIPLDGGTYIDAY